MHPRLKAEQCTVIWYADLQVTVKEVYGQDINVLDMVFEPNNGSNYSFTVDGDTELDTVGDLEIVEKWISTGSTRVDMSDVEEYDWNDFAEVDVNHVLHRLFRDGHISAGKYTITCWW